MKARKLEVDKETTRIKLRKHIKELLDNVVPNCFMTADDTMDFPYTVLDVKESNDEIYIPFYLEAETWDSGDDTTQIENICDAIKEKIDGYQAFLDSFAIKIYFSGCNTNYDEDKTIKRRIQTFEIHMYEFQN
jgi:hypothetical protein